MFPIKWWISTGFSMILAEICFVEICRNVMAGSVDRPGKLNSWTKAHGPHVRRFPKSANKPAKDSKLPGMEQNSHIECLHGLGHKSHASEFLYGLPCAVDPRAEMHAISFRNCLACHMLLSLSRRSTMTGKLVWSKLAPVGHVSAQPSPSDCRASWARHWT